MSRNPSPTPPAVVFFCHGARNAAWRAPFDTLVDEFRARHPGVRAELCFLELMQPDLASTIDALAGEGIVRIRVVPLFLAAGSHTRDDLPAILGDARRRWPGLAVDAIGTLTEDGAIRAAILARAGDALTIRGKA